MKLVLLLLALVVLTYYVRKKEKDVTPTPSPPAPTSPAPTTPPPPVPPPRGPIPAEMEGVFKYTFGQRSYKGVVRNYPTITFEIKNQGAKALGKVILEEPGIKTETDFLPVSIMIDTFSQQAPPKVIFDSMIPSSQNLFQTLEEKYGIVVRKTNIGTIQPTLTYRTSHGGRNVLVNTDVRNQSGYSFDFDYDANKDHAVLKPLIKKYNDDVLKFLRDTGIVYAFDENGKPGKGGLGYMKFNNWNVVINGPHGMYRWPLQGSSTSQNYGNRYIRQVVLRKHFLFRGTYGGKGGRTCTYGLNHCSSQSASGWNCCDRSRPGKDFYVYDENDWIRIMELCNRRNYGKFGAKSKECPDWQQLFISNLKKSDSDYLQPPYVSSNTPLFNNLTKS